MQQRLGLRADGDHVAGVWHPGGGVVNGDRLAEWIEYGGEVTAALCLGRHQPGFSLGDMVARPLVDDEEVRTTPPQMRDHHGSAKRNDAGDGVVLRLGRFEPAERVRAGIEGGVIDDRGEAAIVETLVIGPAIAKCLVE